MSHRTLYVVLFVMAGLVSACTAAERRPNFVFFLVDDLGYMDIGANNPQTFYETPNVDRLAREGMRFTQAYAANPVCSPTRYSIMTGRYPTRVGATNFFSGRRSGRFEPAPLHNRMDLDEVTLAEVLKEQGYKTAFLGKWHLGPTEEFWPEQQGFEINVGGHSAGSPPGGYFAPYKNPRLPSGPDGEHLPMRLASEAEKIIDSFGNDPFLIYFAFHSVHTPLQAPGELTEKYRRKAQPLEGEEEFADEEQILPGAGERKVRILQKHATYAAMVESMDTAIGRVLNKLRQKGIEENTVVCFFSDNGGLSTSEGLPTSNLPLRGGKGWVYEGGIREPMIVKWPGKTQPGSVCDTPVISIDFLPTLSEIAGASLPRGREIDGVSLVGLLTGGELDRGRPLFWHYPHYSNQGGFPGGAIREGDYKLIERYEDGRVHLYNLREDIGERNDLSQNRADKVEQLRDKLHAWYRSVNAQFLEPKGNGPSPWRP